MHRSAMPVREFLEANTQTGRGRSDHWGDSPFVPSVEAIVERTNKVMAERKRASASAKGASNGAPGQRGKAAKASGINVSDFLRPSAPSLSSSSASPPPPQSFSSGAATGRGGGPVSGDSAAGSSINASDVDSFELLCQLKIKARTLSPGAYHSFKEATLSVFADEDDARATQGAASTVGSRNAQQTGGSASEGLLTHKAGAGYKLDEEAGDY